jgi:hypothetical protein
MQPEERPPVWEDGLLDSRLEAQLAQSIRDARAGHLPRDFQTERPGPIAVSSQIHPNATLAQLIAGCGIAAVDGYLAMKDYAAGKGLDLVEMHHKGIDLQDLISTLIIDLRQSEGREANAKRWKR